MKKITFLLFSLLFSGTLLAQETFSLKIDHVALSVKDLDRSADFYNRFETP